MIIRTIFLKFFLCSCNTNYGVEKIKRLDGNDGNSIVGRCMNCNKRVYGRIVYEAPESEKHDAVHAVSETEDKK